MNPKVVSEGEVVFVVVLRPVEAETALEPPKGPPTSAVRPGNGLKLDRQDPTPVKAETNSM